jgi:hypothetical protein
VLDESKWTRTIVTGGGYSGCPGSTVGSYVEETSGMLRIVQNKTDCGGAVRSTPIAVNPTGLITLTLRTLVHAQMHGSSPYLYAGVSISDGSGHLIGFSHYHTTYNSAHGFGFSYTNLVTPVWDNWFTEVLTYDPVTGESTYSVNGGTPIATTRNPLVDSEIKIHLSSYGWWTGHYTQIDFIKLEQEEPAGANGIPIAEAGTDQTVNEKETVTLDGSASSDPENDPLTCYWEQQAGTTVTLSSPSDCNTTFTAPTVPFGGETLTFQLTVNDGTQDSEPDMVNITIKNVNHPPIAVAGDDQTVQEGSHVELDGSDSYDEDSEPLTFKLDQTGGILDNLTPGENGTATFTAPAITTAAETLEFELTVFDGIDYSLPDTIVVTVENVNHAPEADAGEDQTVDENSVVSLNGTKSSDPDNDDLTSCVWEKIEGISVYLQDNSDCTANFTALFLITWKISPSN